MPALELHPKRPLRRLLPRPRPHPIAPPNLARPQHALQREPADHDFLVPNPRPDLTPDAHLLQMLACD